VTRRAKGAPRPAAPAVIARRSPDDLVGLLGSEAGFLEGLVSVDEQRLVLEDYQHGFLGSRARYRWVTKARQVGFSTIIALEALARSHLRKNYAAHIVSFSQIEAKVKLDIARRAYESLPLGAQRRLVTDSKTELAFESAGGVSVIQVHPSKAPRGRNGDIYLDELAHYPSDRAVYQGSTALVTRGGQMTGCSTPLGRRGVFWEIAEQEHERYPNHVRWRVPWWLSRVFCRDIAAAVAAAAAGATPAALVERFGTAALQEQYRGLTHEDFEQEFCCSFAQTSAAYFSPELVLGCTEPDLELVSDPLALPRPRGRYVAGYDVGRTNDRSVLSIFDELDGGFRCAAHLTYKNQPFRVQEAELRRVLDAGLLQRLSIDQGGHGRQLAENLGADFTCVVQEQFTNASKERWANQVRRLLEDKVLRLPCDRDLVHDFHAIRRTILPSGKVSFDADRTTRGHADGFWAVALAVAAGDDGRRVGTVRAMYYDPIEGWIGDVPRGATPRANTVPEDRRGWPIPDPEAYFDRLCPDRVLQRALPPPPRPPVRLEDLPVLQHRPRHDERG
jgi:phage FluMu gp28-like protein